MSTETGRPVPGHTVPLMMMGCVLDDSTAFSPGELMVTKGGPEAALAGEAATTKPPAPPARPATATAAAASRVRPIRPPWPGRPS